MSSIAPVYFPARLKSIHIALATGALARTKMMGHRSRADKKANEFLSLVWAGARSHISMLKSLESGKSIFQLTDLCIVLHPAGYFRTAVAPRQQKRRLFVLSKFKLKTFKTVRRTKAELPIWEAEADLGYINTHKGFSTAMLSAS